MNQLDLPGILADVLELDRDETEHAAKSLTKAGLMLPGDSVGAVSQNAARMLIALLGSDWSILAGLTVERFGRLPAWLLHCALPDPSTGELLGHDLPVEDIDLPPGMGPIVVGLTKSFAGALARFITVAANRIALPLKAWPEHIAIRRTGSPQALLTLGPVTGYPGAQREFVYARTLEEACSYPSIPATYETWTVTRGTVLKMIGERIAEQLETPASEATAASGVDGLPFERHQEFGGTRRGCALARRGRGNRVSLHNAIWGADEPYTIEEIAE